jgi:D-alanyl-D-alanine dipeptidase
MPARKCKPMRSIAAATVLSAFLILAAYAQEPRPSAEEPLVDIRTACPGVLVELRYETARNAAGHAIYPVNARCLLRKSVAARLLAAHRLLAADGLRLKVWDAYRPPSAQAALWAARPNPDFVADPAKGGSLHGWGVAVDVTLVDRLGRELKMPTHFDEIGPAAARRYRGTDPGVARNLRLLQQAMAKAGFLAMRDEWWHFAAADYQRFGPVEPPASIDPEKP